MRHRACTAIMLKAASKLQGMPHASTAADVPQVVAVVEDVFKPGEHGSHVKASLLCTLREELAANPWPQGSAVLESPLLSLYPGSTRSA